MFERIIQLLWSVLEIFNIRIGWTRWELFEWCDLSLIPSIVKFCCQEMLTAQWTHKLPLIQSKAPAELAADLLTQALSDIEDVDTERYVVIDFCSGAGGPTPFIEASVNRSRVQRNERPIPFRLSDLYPNIDAWMMLATRSANLSFIPQPVDATVPAPPASVISKTSSYSINPISGPKTFHLFCLSFHHFGDEAALRVLANTMETSDGFAIIELQDRTIGSVLLMAGEIVLALLATVFWFPHDWVHLLLTYMFPVLPFVLAWDGLVSCLRTRSFPEILALAERAQATRARQLDLGRVGANHEVVTTAVCGDWHLMNVRRKHTWPFGYMDAVVGHKRTFESRRETVIAEAGERKEQVIKRRLQHRESVAKEDKYVRPLASLAGLFVGVLGPVTQDMKEMF